jgi:tetratricopeptide (TPR) repeat protein
MERERGLMDVPGYLRTLSLAEARTDAGQWAAAAGLWRQVTGLNPVNGNHWDRLGQAQYESGDYAAALAAWERAEALGVWDRRAIREERPDAFPGELAYRRACCLARLGDGPRALDELARALGEGLRDTDRVRADECWGELRGRERFRELLDIGPEAASRDDGWRRDLGVFGREVKRRAFAPFRFISEDDFDARLAGLAGRVGELSDAQVATGILALLATLRDGHAGIVGPDDSPALRLSLPLEFWLFPDGPLVTAAAPEHERLLGARLLAVDGRPAGEVLAGLEPVTCRDNEYQLQAGLARWLRCPPVLHALGLAAAPEAVTLKLRDRAGATSEIRLDAVAGLTAADVRGRPAGWIRLAEALPTAPPACERNRDVSSWFEYQRADGLVYAQVNAVMDHPAETLPEFAGRLFAFIDGHAVDTLVLDFRWNGGGNTFLTQPLLHRLIGCRAVNRPGSLFVIIGRRTFSAAQNTVTAIERHTDAIFVGEPTGSSPNFTGELVPFELPWSKLRVNVSDLYWQTSWPMDRRPFIPPELYAPPTAQAWLAGRDPALEAIAAYREHLPI